MSIGVLSSNLNHPIRGYVSFAKRNSFNTMLFDHLLGVLEVAKLQVFEMVFGVDNGRDVAFEEARARVLDDVGVSILPSEKV